MPVSRWGNRWKIDDTSRHLTLKSLPFHWIGMTIKTKSPTTILVGHKQKASMGGFWNLRCLTPEYLNRTMFKCPGHLKIRYAKPWFWAFNIVSRFDKWSHLREFWRDWSKRWLHPENKYLFSYEPFWQAEPKPGVLESSHWYMHILPP